MAAAALLSVLTLRKVGPEPDDRRILLRLSEVSRVAASLRHGRWDDPDAVVDTFSFDVLSGVVRSFGAQNPQSGRRIVFWSAAPAARMTTEPGKVTLAATTQL